MEREDKYLLGCLYAIHKLQEKGSSQYAVKVDGEWETMPWEEICKWIEGQYAIEGEKEMKKHTDREIYDGCIHLMQNMVDYFQEYLDYLGYDLDLLDEDERFTVGMSNMEIIRQLFLYQTRNSGGCSTKDFCEKLGVDPYKSVKFEFDWYEEE